MTQGRLAASKGAGKRRCRTWGNGSLLGFCLCQGFVCIFKVQARGQWDLLMLIFWLQSHEDLS